MYMKKNNIEYIEKYLKRRVEINLNNIDMSDKMSKKDLQKKMLININKMVRIKLNNKNIQILSKDFIKTLPIEKQKNKNLINGKWFKHKGKDFIAFNKHGWVREDGNWSSAGNIMPQDCCLANPQKIESNCSIVYYVSRARYYTTIPQQVLYEKLKSKKNQNIYELIHEDSPCQLYFDLDESSEEHLKLLLKLMKEALPDIEFAISGHNEGKFSRHLVATNYHFSGSTHLKESGFTDYVKNCLQPFINTKVNATNNKKIMEVDSQVYRSRGLMKAIYQSKQDEKKKGKWVKYTKQTQLPITHIKNIKNHIITIINKDSKLITNEFKKYININPKINPKKLDKVKNKKSNKVIKKVNDPEKKSNTSAFKLMLANIPQMRKPEEAPEIDVWRDEPTAILKAIPPFYVDKDGKKKYHNYNTYFFIQMWAAFTTGRNKITFKKWFEWTEWDTPTWDGKNQLLMWKNTWDHIKKNYKPKKDGKYQKIRKYHIKLILEKCYGGWKDMRLQRFKKTFLKAEDCDLLLGDERANKYNGKCYVEYTDYDITKKVNLNKSNMGAGKTKSFVDFTHKNNVESAIVLSCRRTLAYDFYRATKVYEFGLYSEVSDIESWDRLICQLESITRLGKKELVLDEDEDGNEEWVWKWNVKHFDLVVLDEIESLLQIFNVDATLRTKCKNSYKIKFKQAWEILKQIIKNAKWVFGFDALMTKRTLDFFKLQGIERDNIYLIGREDKFDKINKKIDYYADWKYMLKRVCNMVAAGKKMYIFYPRKNGKKHDIMGIVDLKNFIIKEVQEITKNKFTPKIQEYHGKSQNKKTDFKCVNKTWANADVVIVNSCVSCGISYENVDKKFHSIAIFYSAYIAPRIVIQSSMRVRECAIKTNRIMYTNIPSACFSSIDELPSEAYGLENDKCYMKLEDYNKDEYFLKGTALLTTFFSEVGYKDQHFYDDDFNMNEVEKFNKKIKKAIDNAGSIVRYEHIPFMKDIKDSILEKYSEYIEELENSSFQYWFNKFKAGYMKEWSDKELREWMNKKWKNREKYLFKYQSDIKKIQRLSFQDKLTTIEALSLDKYFNESVFDFEEDGYYEKICKYMFANPVERDFYKYYCNKSKLNSLFDNILKISFEKRTIEINTAPLTEDSKNKILNTYYHKRFDKILKDPLYYDDMKVKKLYCDYLFGRNIFDGRGKSKYLIKEQVRNAFSDFCKYSKKLKTFQNKKIEEVKENREKLIEELYETIDACGSKKPTPKEIMYMIDI